jgi:hypothetical protein
MKNSSCHDARIEGYCEEVQRLEDKFFSLELNHVARWYNEVADKLAKIASGWTIVPLNIFARDIYKPSVVPKEVPEPAPHDDASPADGPKAMQIDSDKNGAAPATDWRAPYLECLLRGELPPGKDKARRLTQRAKTFRLLGEEMELYRHSPSGIL